MIRFRRVLIPLGAAIIACSLLITGVVRSAPVAARIPDLAREATQTDSPKYSCNIHVGNNRHNCTGHVTAQPTAAGQWVLAADMGADHFRRLDVFAEVCEPRDWVLHVADSPTANGFGGDSSTADHDAEAYLYNGSDFGFDSTGDYTSHEHDTRMRLPRVLDPDHEGCRVVHLAAFHPRQRQLSRLEFVAANREPVSIGSIHGLKLGYQACLSASDPRRSIDCDWEDRQGNDQYRWHIGLNRTVGSAWRHGKGVTRACVLLSADVTHMPQSCL